MLLRFLSPFYAMPAVFSFEECVNAPLLVDAIYQSGPATNQSADPMRLILPKCSTSGGIRKINRQDGSKLPAYVVLFTTLQELEWPDYLDVETGILRYYGDNREAGAAINEKNGNKLFEQVFEMLNTKRWSDIPPFLVFQRVGNSGRSVRFLGLAAPGNTKISPDRDLVAFWRTVKENRFQNYEAYFTILNTGSAPITQAWLQDLITDHDKALAEAPAVWREFTARGRDGINALTAPRLHAIPSKQDQLACDEEGRDLVAKIHSYYQENPYGFEACAADIVMKLDRNFEKFELTRPWRDGGRDALGLYKISSGISGNIPLKIDCALEAKCYEYGNSVGVRQMSRLISRIRYRQFGVMVTTSCVDTQAYQEVVDDGHPILIVTCRDIVSVLKHNRIDASNINDWLSSVETRFPRMQ